MKKFICFLIIMVSVCLCGCAPKYDKSIDTITNTIKYVNEKLDNIDVGSKTYNLKSEDNEIIEGNGYDGSSFVNGKNYNKKPKNTDNYSVFNTVFLVNTVKSKGSILLGLCDVLKESNVKISKNMSSAIVNFCDSIKHNINYINKNTSLFNEKIDYKRIVNNLDNQNACLNTICYNFDNLYNIIQRCTNKNKTNKDVKNKNSYWRNIDGYVNKNTKNANYYNGYGYGNTNPYYNNYRYNQMPYYGYQNMNNMRNFYPYSPYSGYNPYMPNIDTFGSYSNIDTFRPINEDYYYNYKPYLPVHKCEDKKLEENENNFKITSKEDNKKDTKICVFFIVKTNYCCFLLN